MVISDCCVSCCRFYRRTAKRQHEVLEDTLVDDQPLPEEQFLDGQKIETLRSALHQLSDEHQTILILRFVERKTHEEVALILNKTVPAIKNAQFRALSRLTELLGQERKFKHYLRGTHG
ncbi:sigma-70 family RNA polymerase sigma factor [bacterium]|nr:sigma-70 family RNA polymerase sigma factor [bacterium]